MDEVTSVRASSGDEMRRLMSQPTTAASTTATVLAMPQPQATSVTISRA
jgi:hypothetical protein